LDDRKKYAGIKKFEDDRTVFKGNLIVMGDAGVIISASPTNKVYCADVIRLNIYTEAEWHKKNCP